MHEVLLTFFITLVFDRCPRSSAAETPAKYERDSNDLADSKTGNDGENNKRCFNDPIHGVLLWNKSNMYYNLFDL